MRVKSILANVEIVRHIDVGVRLFGSEEPDLFLDVTETFDLKREALYRHVSQVGVPTDERENRARSRYAEVGKKIGVSLAEQFKQIEIWR